MIATNEHERILRAVEALEDGLRYLASQRPRAWRQRLLRDLRPVDDCLREHCAAAERPGGVIADVEVVIGRLPEVTVARLEHDEMTALAAGLLAEVEPRRGAARLADGRVRGARLAEALRRHLVGEIDLIQLRYTLDVGVVD